jgi:hypothetical protein
VRRLLACASLALVLACERPKPASREAITACRFARTDTLAISGAARDTIARLKGEAQQVTEITPVSGGIAVRTEDADSTAFHNGGAVSFDCAKRVTSVWLDGG